MSARMPVTLMENIDGDDVHGWLGRVIGDVDDAGPAGSTRLAAVCSSAVDPLEIAVALEVAGISHAVATNRYNRADVFALARTLWGHIPLRPAVVEPATLPRSGDRRDLARGLLYVLPALMLLAITTSFDLHLARWVLPLAISWGWGLGQVTAFVGYRMQGTDLPHEATVMARVVVGAALSTLLISTVAAFVAGGDEKAVIAATALVTYMATSAILLVRAEERWLALLLLPGARGSVFVLIASKGSMASHTVAIVFIGGSFIAVAGRALRQTKLHVAGRRNNFARRDLLVACEHLLHGVICGLAVSLVVIHSGHLSSDDEFGRMLLPVPLLAALGVMEWQLHTFRSRIAHLTHSLQSIEEFPRPARLVLVRSVATCVAAISLPAGAVMLAVGIHGGDIAFGALTLQCVLGAVLFTDLILVLLDRLDLVLRSWIAGIAAAGIALLAIIAFTHRDLAAAAFPAACLLVAAVLVLLLLEAREVVAAAMNH
ncbi:MAG: hypothetical protein ACXWBO_03180 [Ilumatobacteraceae bacterium]